jgi:hypothetical protein
VAVFYAEPNDNPADLGLVEDYRAAETRVAAHCEALHSNGESGGFF